MTTEAQVLANRSNAAKSTGPRTKTGKAIVAQNAVKHGLFAHQDVIAEEDPQQYGEHRQRLLEELSPAGQMETILAGRIVSLTWRLKRAETLANELFDYLLAKELENSIGRFFDQVTDKDQEDMRRYVDTDPEYAVGRMIAKDYRGEKTLDRLGMHERRIEGSLYRTTNELRRLKLAPKKEGVHGTPYKNEPVGQESNCAKQSQTSERAACETKPIDSVVGWGLPHQEPRVAEGGGASPTPHAGADAAEDPACETKPIDPDKTVCGVPARALVETQDIASLQEPPRDEDNAAKQSQSLDSAACETKPIALAGPGGGT